MIKHCIIKANLVGSIVVRSISSFKCLNFDFQLKYKQIFGQLFNHLEMLGGLLEKSLMN